MFLRKGKNYIWYFPLELYFHKALFHDKTVPVLIIIKAEAVERKKCYNGILFEKKLTKGKQKKKKEKKVLLEDHRDSRHLSACMHKEEISKWIK
jgi:hypothetical protein